MHIIPYNRRLDIILAIANTQTVAYTRPTHLNMALLFHICTLERVIIQRTLATGVQYW